MKRKLLSLALVAAGLVGPAFPLLAASAAHPAAQAAAVDAPDPARQVRELARLFRAGDVPGLVHAMVPPSQWEKIRSEYERERAEPISTQEREEFAENIARFTAPDAVDRLMAEIEPKLEEARPQYGGALLMAYGAAQMAISSQDTDLTPEQRAQLEAVLPGAMGWASNTDFLSSDTMRQALTLLTDAARRTGLTTLDQIKALPLDAVLQRTGPVFAAAKEAVRLYGVDLDAIADSLQVEVLEVNGDQARVRTTITLFDTPLWADHDLVLVEGRWYGKHALAKFHHHHDRDDDKFDVDVDVES
jgi:hypothetical protein